MIQQLDPFRGRLVESILTVGAAALGCRWLRGTHGPGTWAGRHGGFLLPVLESWNGRESCQRSDHTSPGNVKLPGFCVDKFGKS